MTHLPLYGKINSISSSGSHLLTTLCFDLESNTHLAHVIDLQKVFGAKNQVEREQAVASQKLNSPGVQCLSSKDNNYIITESEILSFSNGSFTTIKEGLSDISLSECMYNGNIILVQGKEANIFSSSGALEQSIALRAEATAVAISQDNQILAFGFVDGLVEVFKMSAGSFQSVKKEGTRGSNPLVMHEDAAVTSLAIVRYDDNRQWMFSFGEDRKAMQAHTEELIASERASTGLHEGLVKSIISNNALDRIHTVSHDGEAKSWVRSKAKTRPATESIVTNATAAAFVRFEQKDANRQIMQKKNFLVFSGGSEADGQLEFWSLTNDDSGKLDSHELTINTGLAWFEEFHKNENEETRRHVIDTIGSWGVRFLDSLVNVAKRKGEDKSIQIHAVRTIHQTGLPAAQYKLSDVITRSQERKTRVVALEYYASIDKSNAPLELGLANYCKEVFEATINILGERSKTSTEARALLEDAVQRESWKEAEDKIAKHALNKLYELDHSVDALLLGVNNPLLEQHAMEEIYRRGHLGELKAQAQFKLLLQNDNQETRLRAQDILFLRFPQLATFARAKDESLHHRLCQIESVEKEISEQPEQIDAATVPEEAKELINQLMAAPHSDISSYATSLSTSLGSNDTLAPLLIFMSSDDSQVRTNAINGLIEVQSEYANSGLTKAFCTDEVSTIRQLAFDGVENSTQKFRNALSSEHQDIRKRALNGISQSLRQEITTELRDLVHRALLNQKFDDVAKGAYQIHENFKLGGKKQESLKVLTLNANLLIREMAREEITAMLLKKTADALDLAKHALTYEDSDEAKQWFRSAVHSFKRDTKNRTEFILFAMKNKYESVRYQALNFIHKNPGMDIGTHLIAAITGDESQTVRNEAFRASRAYWKHLRKTTDKGERQDTQESDSFAQKFFSACILSTYEEIQDEVFTSFSASEEGWRLEILKKSLQDKKASIRSRGAAMLIELGGKGLDVLLESEHLDLRIRAARALSKRGDERAIPPLKEVLSIPMPKEEDEKYHIGNTIDSEAHDKDLGKWENDMIWALSSAKELRAKELLPELYHIIENPQGEWDGTIQTPAMEALGMIASPTSEKDVDLLKGFLGTYSSKTAGIALARMGIVEGLDAVWQSADEALQYELLLALGDHSYVLRSMAQGSGYTKELILAFVLQAMFKGGSLTFLTDALTASDKSAVLLSARLLEVIGDREALLAQLQRELNEWNPISINLVSEASIGDNYFGFAEYLNAYFSFANTLSVEKRRRKIELSSWSLVAQLLSNDDPRIRSQAASLLYRYKKQGISDDRFMTELAILSDRYLSSSPTKSTPIDMDASVAKLLAFGSYRNLASSVNESKSLRKEALYSYVQGLHEELIHNPSISSLLQQLLLDSDLAPSAYGHLLHHQETLGIQNVVELGLLSRSLQTQKMAVALLIRENNTQRLQTLATEEKEKVAEVAFDQLYMMYDSSRILRIFQDVHNGRNSLLSPSSWYIRRVQFASDQDAMNMAKDSEQDASGISFVHTNADVRAAFEALANEYNAKRIELYSQCIQSNNLNVQEKIIDKLIRDIQDETSKKTPNTSLVEKYTDILKASVTSPDKALRNKSLFALGRHGHVDMLPALLDNVHQVTDTVEQNKTYTAIQMICKANRNEEGSLPPSLSAVAPALVNRWFNDPSGKVVTHSISAALKEIDDPQILPTLFERLKNYGENREVYNLIISLSGYYAAPPSSNWDSFTEKDQKMYKNRRYDDDAIVQLLSRDLRNSRWGGIHALLKCGEASIQTDTPILTFALEKVLLLPDRSECNNIVRRALKVVEERIANRSSIDSPSTPTTIQNHLISLLKHKDVQRAFYAARILAQMGNDAGLMLLATKAADVAEKSIQTRVQAFESLGRIANKGILSLLLKFAGYDEFFQLKSADELKAMNQEIRAAAMSALGSMHSSSKSEEVLALLRNNLMSSESALQLGAARGLAFFKKKAYTVIHEEYENLRSSPQVRALMLSYLAEDTSNTAYLLELLRFELSVRSYLVNTAHEIIKNRDQANIEADCLLLDHQYFSNDHAIEAVCTHGSDQELLKYAHLAWKNNHDYQPFIDALINQKQQKELGRAESYPVDLILDFAKSSIENEEFDFIESEFIPFNASFSLENHSKQKLLATIDAAQNIWTEAYTKKQRGSNVEAELDSASNIWHSLLSFGKEHVQDRIALLITTEGISDELLSWGLQNITVTPQIVPVISGLLSHNNRDVRTSIAALLSAHSITTQDAERISNDPAAQFLIRGTSGAALMDSAKNGSLTAIGHLARAHDYDSLRNLLMDVQTQEEVRKATANSLASLGKQEANALLVEANDNFEGSSTLKGAFARALSRGTKRQKKNKEFASRKKN